LSRRRPGERAVRTHHRGGRARSCRVTTVVSRYPPGYS
jgi:hypothetical protein